MQRLVAVIFVMIFVPFSNSHSFENDSRKECKITENVNRALEHICPHAKVLTKSALNADMRKYLDKSKVQYTTVIRGDFNGDKLLDWAMLVECSNKTDIRVERLIVMLQKADKDYVAYILEEFSRISDDIYLCSISPSTIQEWDTSKSVNLKYQSIERVFDEKSAGIYYWKKDKFEYIQTSD